MRNLQSVLIVLTILGAATLTAEAQICGGIGGIQCPSVNQFCQLPEGQCCCDFLGQCVSVPGDCPAIFDPVCGCDGQTYSNRCRAQQAQVSVDHPGPCFDVTRLVTNVQFQPFLGVTWSVPPNALSSNVYRKSLYTGAPDDFGDCFYADISTPQAPIPGDPAPGELWLLQITAMFGEGEGPMGIGTNGLIRRPAQPCVCTLPADVGPCDGTFPRWFHNFETDQCEPFVWGGCGGNANNFETLEACEAECRDTCGLPPDTGPCEALIPRWFFSEDTGECERFIWGGCDGNANNFETFALCQDACVCSLPPDVGPCDAIVPRWFHNSSSGLCEQFIWGGCEGNANNFETQAVCEASCPEP